MMVIQFDIGFCKLWIYKKGETYLNMVMEFIPQTVYSVIRYFNKQRSHIPQFYVKVFF
jgi:glycogen synthase kinase 3 beta